MKKQLKKWFAKFLALSVLISVINPFGLVAYAVSTIGSFNGTSVSYDEASVTPIQVAPNISITDADGFNENGSLEFTVTGAKTSEQLDVTRVANVGAILTGLDAVSIYQNTVYLGTGGAYKAIASIDGVKNGQNGNALKINFSRELENANFDAGTVNLNLAANDLPGWTIAHGTYNLTAAGLNQRSLGNELTIAGAAPYTMTKANPAGYSYTTDFNYGGGTAPWLFESVERPRGTLSTTVSIVTDAGGAGGRALKLTSSGQVVNNNNDGGTDKYGSHFGPVITSAPFTAKSGDTLSMDWKAQFNQDHYEVYAYVKNTGTNATTLLFYGRGENQTWTTSTATIPADGTYEFIFINGTYDKTGMFGVGSTLWIDNIKVYGETYSGAVATKIAKLVTYSSTDADPSATRTVNIKVVNKNSEEATASATININGQFSHAPTLTASSYNPNYNNGATSDNNLFYSTASSTVESADRFERLVFTVSGLLDGNKEVIIIDGEDVSLENATSGTTVASSINYVVSVAADTATVTLTHAGLTEAQMNTLVNGLKYKNTLATPTIGSRVITLTGVKDTGNLDVGNNGKNEKALTIASTVRVSNVIKTFVNTSRTANSADFTWTAPTGATALQIQQSTNGGANWVNSTHAALAVDAASGTVTGLTATQAYKFRLVVTNGVNSGASNAVDVAALSNNTLVTSASYTVSNGQTANETISGVISGTTKANFLAVLAKGHPNQNWDDTQIGATVAVGDRLIVTAEDGVKTTTYTVPKLVFNGLNTPTASVQSVSLSWSSVAGATALKVQVSSDGGTTWVDGTHVALLATSTSTIVTSLNSGSAYKFRLVITGGDYAGNSNVVSANTTIAYIPTTTNTSVEVNGQKQDAGTSQTTTAGGQTTTTITVDDKKLDKLLEGSGAAPTVTLPGGTGSDVVVGELNGQTIKNMENKEAILEIKTDSVTYTLPASQINIDDVSSQLGSQVALKDIKVSVSIAEPSADTVKIVEDTANKGNYQLVVKPVEFTITCTSGDKTVEVSKFNGYVERTVAIPDGVDPSKITTGIVLNADGTFSHVPTTIVVIKGKYYAKINSLTNSTYSVIWNPVEFADVANHWAKTAINDMGSRMVVTGIGSSTYEPDRSITRAEFAAVVVRALGLQKGKTESSFGDVTLTDWFNGYVDTATAYSLITGYDSTSYGPNDTITREQAMAIIARAMKLTDLSVSLTDSEVSTLLTKYTDGAIVSSYAKASAAVCLKNGVVTGSSATTLSPKAYVTRAEVAVMVQRLLIKSGLI